jgi:signal peptidase I
MSGHQSWIESFDAATATPTEPETGRGGQVLLGCCAAFCVPGLGHLLLGRYVAAIVFAGLTFGAAAGAVLAWQKPDQLPTMIQLAVAAIALYVIQVLDAGRGARGRDVPLLPVPPARYMVGFMLALGALYWQRSVVVTMQERVFELCYSPTPSMSPAIDVSDYFLNLKDQPLERWDLAGVSMPATYAMPEMDLVKRVVGLPGETVELTPAGVMINGRIVKPPAGVGAYGLINLRHQPLTKPDPRIAGNGCWGRPITLGTDEYYLLGDNTRESYDARLWPSVDGRQPGAVPASRMSGRIAAIVWPPQRMRLFTPEPDMSDRR